jgi:hypothetical protein
LTVEPRESELQSGQVSPDGLWQWNGDAWLPTTGGIGPSQGPSSALRARRIVLIAVLCALAAIAAVATLVSLIHFGADNCLPSDFPIYSGATVSSTVARKGSPPDCALVLRTSDSQSTVAQFYESILNTGDWHVMSVSSDTGTVKFERRSRPKTTGSVSYVAHADGTRIYIRLKGG